MSKLLSAKLLSMGGSIYFHCPGCDMLHPYRVKGDAPVPVWSFNGDFQKPTFTPSLLVDKDKPERCCHLFMTDGKLHYCSDSWHDLAGKTVDMVDIPEPEVWLD